MNYLFKFLEDYPFQSKGRNFYRQYFTLVTNLAAESTLEDVPLYLISMILALGNLVSDSSGLEFG